MSALNNLRVLELSSGVAAEYCGKLLADFGAQVIKAEASGEGGWTRAHGPFVAGGKPHESSGLFAYLNTNKQSAALDLASAGGQQALRTLSSSVDVILDDHPKGYLQALGIDPSGLIVCSITPFGYDAPASLHIARSLNVFHSSWGYHSPAQADPAKPPLTGPAAFCRTMNPG